MGTDWIGMRLDGRELSVRENGIPDGAGTPVFLTFDAGRFTVSDGGLTWKGLAREKGEVPPGLLCRVMTGGRVTFAPNGVLYTDVSDLPGVLEGACAVAEAIGKLERIGK